MSEEKNKPLRLVLKVGGHTSTANSSPASVLSTNDDGTSDRKRKHKKKRKKEKRRRKEREEDEEDSDIEDMASPFTSAETGSKISEFDQEDKDDKVGTASISSRLSRHSNESESCMSRSLRGRRQEEELSALQQLLDYLQRILQRKDVNGFFAFPVTDQIAPKYSEIIQQPMDFSTMKSKIDSNAYKSVIEYKSDFRLMMQNCMTYNHPDTIFHKEAEKQLNFGLKNLSREKLVTLKRGLAFLSDITDTELGLDVDDNVAIVEYKKQHSEKCDSLSDDLSPEELVAQVREAAEQAASKLNRKNPHGKVGFLRCQKDGTTSFNFLNPANDGIVGEKERIISFGDFAGHLKEGACNLAGFREDKRNKLNPVSYLTYGPFSSYAPTYDSSSANLSKEESDLLLSTYGSDLGIAYAHSIRTFVEGSNNYCVQLVDGLLNIMTNGEHSETMKTMEKLAKEKEAAAQAATVATQCEDKPESATMKTEMFSPISDVSQDDDAAKEDLGVGDHMQANTGNLRETNYIQQQLGESADLIGQLRDVQHQRLSAPLPFDLSQVPKPGKDEEDIAAKLKERLAKLTQMVRPGDVVSQPTLRAALGIGQMSSRGLDPTIPTPLPLPNHKGIEPISPPTPPTVAESSNREEQWSTIQEVLQEDFDMSGASYKNSNPGMNLLQLPTVLGDGAFSGSSFSTRQDNAETEAAISNILN